MAETKTTKTKAAKPKAENPKVEEPEVNVTEVEVKDDTYTAEVTEGEEQTTTTATGQEVDGDVQELANTEVVENENETAVPAVNDVEPAATE